MARRRSLPCFCAVALAAAACSSESPSVSGADGGLAFPDAPLVTVTSDSGALRLEVRTAPNQPPTRGNNVVVQYRITDTVTAAAMDGLNPSVVPWMPAMGHGASVVPTVTAAGNGIYVVTNLSLIMPGRWELRTTLHAASEDHASPSLQVQ